MLPDGRRLHLQHGPIDLVVEANGHRDEVAAAYRHATARFQTVLPELVGELQQLRRPVVSQEDMNSPVARRMARAVLAHSGSFITPMAAVAGAVADEILAALCAGRALSRAYVNNGGDIALHLAPGRSYTAGLVDRLDCPRPDGRCTITHGMPVRGIATSGRDGRSFSLGVADAVTVLARDAAAADAAATLIANAVTIDHPSVRHAPAETLDPDSDLGKLLVTTAVGPLDDHAVAVALAGGTATAAGMYDRGIIHAAVLCLNGRYRTIGAGLADALPAAVPAVAGAVR